MLQDKSSFNLAVNFEELGQPLNKKELPTSLVKHLSDKSYLKRRKAADDIIKLVQANVKANDHHQIWRLYDYFRREYFEKRTEINRLTALFAFQAMAVGISSKTQLDIPNLFIDPVLICFRDQYPIVRYYAVEAMYNIYKICRIQLLPHLTEVFRGIVELFADIDNDVRKAAQQLDYLLKIIVVESAQNQELMRPREFIDLLSEMISMVRNPNVQQMLISWLRVLDSIESFDLLQYLPSFIEGLFIMVSSQNKDVKHASFGFLLQLLNQVIKFPSKALVIQDLVLRISKIGQHSDMTVRLMAIKWIREILIESGDELIQQYPACLGLIFKALSDPEYAIVSNAEQTNNMLLEKTLQIIKNDEDKTINLSWITQNLLEFLEDPSLQTREAVLDWVVSFQRFSPGTIEQSLDSILYSLKSNLINQHEDASQQTIRVICRVALYQGYFEKVMEALFEIFKSNPDFLQRHKIFILKFLCNKIGPHKVFQDMSQQLCTYGEFEKMCILVFTDQLLTQSYLEPFRERLKYCLERADMESIQLFEKLFYSWCIAPVAALILTLLVQAYELAYKLLQILSHTRVTGEMLIHMSILVNLLESPIFVRKIYIDLRMQILEHERHPFLLRALYAIMMFLPQTNAFHALKLRLANISTLNREHWNKGEEPFKFGEFINYEKLEEHFERMVKQSCKASQSLPSLN